jgi:hypothetical protein
MGDIAELESNSLARRIETLWGQPPTVAQDGEKKADGEQITSLDDIANDVVPLPPPEQDFSQDGCGI